MSSATTSITDDLTTPGGAARASVVGSLLAAHSVGFLVGSLGGARLLDHTNGHTVMAVALILMAAGPAIAPLARRSGRKATQGV